MALSPRLTVALPTCNGARHLRATLAGIRDQHGVEFDLVVADDRSEDDTLAIIGSELGDRARVEVNTERLGLAGNWNRCVALSRTPLVAIVHQDDVLRPSHLAAHLARFVAEDGDVLGLVASAVNVIDAEGRAVPPSVIDPGGLGGSDRTFPRGALVPELAVGNPLRCSAVTLRAAAHAAIGGFDPSFRYVVDWDFWLRVARTWPVAWLASPTVAVRWHPASETHRFRAGTSDLEEVERLLADLFATEGAALKDRAALRRTARRRLSRAYLNRAYDAALTGDPAMVRRCLRRAVRLWPGILATLARDPRLAARLVLPR